MHSKNSFEELALKYWKQSVQDFKDAQSYLKKQAFTQSAVLSCQSANNCLSAICISRKNHQNPNHSLSDMLAVCSSVDVAFNDLSKACLLLDQINVFPFFSSNGEQKQMDKNKATDFVQASETVLKLSKTIVQKHRLFKINHSIIDLSWLGMQ